MADRAQDEIKSHVLTYFRGEGAELKDTMQDLMLDLLGSGAIAIVSFFLLRKQRKNLNDK